MKKQFMAALLASMVLMTGSAQASYSFGESYSSLSIDRFKEQQPGFREVFSFPTAVGSATLSIAHNGNLGELNINGFGELWAATVNDIPVSVLSKSYWYDWDTNEPFAGWVNDTFSLSQNIIDAINSNQLSAVIAFSDSRSKSVRSGFTLNSLSIQAEPVPTPLPAAFILFVPGLAGLLAARKRLGLL
jgi:hypothetical protein